MKRLIGMAMVGWLGFCATTAQAVSDAWDQETVMANAVKVAEWTLRNPRTRSQLDWTYGAFYQGVAALGLADPAKPFLGIVREHGKKNGWGHLSRTYHADDHCIAQSWLELAFYDNNPTYWKRIQQNYDYIMANPHTGPMKMEARDSQKRWNWCDALFMSPTVLVRLGGLTGDSRYWTFMDQEYRATYDLLYSRESHLFFRDTRYIEKRTKNGKRVFWSRGEGWVFGGLAVILRDLPGDWPTRPFYEGLFREMAEALRAAQHEDGAWGPSILDPNDPDMQEMSGTAFFTFGMIWGINNGLLDRGVYLPTVQKAWRAICRNINEEGRLGWVQQIGDRPVSDYGEASSEVYASGAFLDAAMELRKLIASESHPKRVTVTVENPAPFFRPAETVELAWPIDGVAAENLRVFDCRNGRVLPYQLVDEDQDGTLDKLLFALPMMARQRREVWLFNGTDLPAAPTDAVCVSRYAPDRMDDYAWENDRVACRVYGPVIMQPPPKGEGLVSSGVDVWNKSVPYPVFDKWLKRKSYHKDEGEGMDNYKVGVGRGCGGVGLSVGGRWFFSQNWAAQRHLYSGPVRTAFELTYAAWPCGDGSTVKEIRRMSLDAGSHFTRFESRFVLEGPARPMVGPGLDISAKREHNGRLTLRPDQGWIANYEPEQEGNGSIATAIVFPGGGVLATDPEGCLYLQRALKSGEPTVWYAGSAWSGAHAYTESGTWAKSVEAFALTRAQPLRITLH